jgi:hypothetical protein
LYGSGPGFEKMKYRRRKKTVLKTGRFAVCEQDKVEIIKTLFTNFLPSPFGPSGRGAYCLRVNPPLGNPGKPY